MSVTQANLSYFHGNWSVIRANASADLFSPVSAAENGLNNGMIIQYDRSISLPKKSTVCILSLV